MVGDVAREAEGSAAAGDILDRFGRVDVLVNNAGVIRGGYLAEMTEEAIRYQFDVNVIGTINCTQAFADALSKTRGSVINLSSALAKRPLLASRSAEHTSELPSLMRISFSVFCSHNKHHKTHMHED